MPRRTRRVDGGVAVGLDESLEQGQTVGRQILGGRHGREVSQELGCAAKASCSFSLVRSPCAVLRLRCRERGRVKRDGASDCATFCGVGRGSSDLRVVLEQQ